VTAKASTLDRLTIGQSAQVQNIRGDDAIAVRLMEMGLIPGTPVTVVGAAPLGDPLELDVRGYHLSVRRAEAARVEIAS
jgi:ferrous iron transport protein A